MSASPRWYFDSGIWLAPLLANQQPEVVDRCLNWQRRCADCEIKAVASTLVWDEVAFIAGRRRGLPFDFAAAARAGALWRALPGLEIVPVDAEVLGIAQQLLQHNRLRPRDSLHAASAMLRADGRLLTLDGDFPAGLSVAGLPRLVTVRLDRS